jgi:hypothetical protein
VFSGYESDESILLQVQRLEAALRLSGNVLGVVQLEHSVAVVPARHHVMELFHLHLLVRRDYNRPVAQVVPELNMTATQIA